MPADSPLANVDVLAVGPNSVLQKSLSFAQLKVGGINRARGLTVGPGGKGYHFALAANTARPGSAAVAHFLGGENGRQIAQQLDELGLPQLQTPIAGESRTCITLLDDSSGEMTELIEPSPEIQPSEASNLSLQISVLMPRLRGLALCGTTPPGCGDHFYAELAESANKDALVLLDGYKGVQDILATGRVDVLKINLHELSELSGQADVVAGAEWVFAAFAVRVLALTDGPSRAHLFADSAHWGFELPVLRDVVNPIGAGDTVGAVLLQGLLAGDPAPEAFRLGLAAASASCRSIHGARFTMDEARDLACEIRIGELSQ
jgi:fructose-1-phosphate kinase PfkB-like protein